MSSKTTVFVISETHHPRKREKPMKYIEKLNKLYEGKFNSLWSERIVSELVYLDAISKNNSGIYDADIEKAADYLLAAIDEDGAITKAIVLKAEEMLSHLVPVAKSYTELFVGHAHIDMNWMWSYNETAGVVVDTFRTMLDIMREFPDFTFAQSQASTYEIIEKYCPSMLPEIKQRIHEGRWEVTAAEWVEPDKNMPDGESLSRHVLQTRKYLSKLLDLDESSFDLDFVPDTFGHSISIPTVLANAGVKYMYHWRCGEENPRVYYYVAPSGKKVLTYREFVCYLGWADSYKFEIVPEFAAQTGLKTYLCVFGVGDHGGGPTRRDIEHILEYKTWPLTPKIEFGTFRQFFKYIEESGVEIPEVNKELNFIFNGCYTSQSRIKMANRFGEARLKDAEQVAASAGILEAVKRDPNHLDRAWRNVLFSHFHDILPGSGVLETREYAMGQFQDTMAYANVYTSECINKIADKIDTSSIEFVDVKSAKEGGGAGYNQDAAHRWSFPVAGRGRGPVRVFHVFNTLGQKRHEFTKIVVWNYEGDGGRVAFYTPDGKKLRHTTDGGENINRGFWGHSCTTYLVEVTVPALSYTTVIMKPDYKDGEHLEVNREEYTRENETPFCDVPIVLENEYIKATFDRMTAQITELIDKASGRTLIDKPSAFLSIAEENGQRGMSSWVVGYITKEINLHDDPNSKIRVVNECPSGSRKSLKFEIRYHDTFIEVTVVLMDGSRSLVYDIHTIWREEAPSDRTIIPQLRFSVPVSYERTGKCIYDTQYGTIARDEIPYDVPALSFLGMESKTGNSIGLITDTKYGFRCYNGTGIVDLIRSSFDPDIIPERGHCYIKVALTVAPVEELKEISDEFNHPMPVACGTPHKGTLPLEKIVAGVAGNVILSSMKVSEDGQGTAFRLFDNTGCNQTAVIELCTGIKEAYLTDSNETTISRLPVENGKVTVTVPAKDFITVVIK